MHKFAYFIGGPADLTKMVVPELNSSWNVSVLPNLVGTLPFDGELDCKILTYDLEMIFRRDGNTIGVYVVRTW